LGERTPGGEGIVKFICDEQLGRLAKWLRIQGCDTVFQCPFPDDRLLRRAHDDKRTLLTRDRSLSSKTLWPVVFIKAVHFREQIKELRLKVRMPKASLFSRCLRCNTLIRPLPRSKAQDKVPQEVFDSYKEFFICRDCRQIYWKGSHVKNTEARLLELG